MKYVNTNVSLPCCFRQNANISTNIFRLTIMIFDQYETNSQQGFPAWFPALNYIATAFTFLPLQTYSSMFAFCTGVS